MAQYCQHGENEIALDLVQIYRRVYDRKKGPSGEGPICLGSLVVRELVDFQSAETSISKSAEFADLIASA